MSKTRQRRISMYQQGRIDARQGYYRWRRHRHLAAYDRGYRDESTVLARYWWQVLASDEPMIENWHYGPGWRVRMMNIAEWMKWAARWALWKMTPNANAQVRDGREATDTSPAAFCSAAQPATNYGETNERD